VIYYDFCTAGLKEGFVMAQRITHTSTVKDVQCALIMMLDDVSISLSFESKSSS